MIALVNITRNWQIYDNLSIIGEIIIDLDNF